MPSLNLNATVKVAQPEKVYGHENRITETSFRWRFLNRKIFENKISHFDNSFVIYSESNGYS